MLTIGKKICGAALALATTLIACSQAGAATSTYVDPTGDRLAVTAGGTLIGAAFDGGSGALIGGAIGAEGAYASTVGYDRYDRRDGYYDRWGVFHYYDRYYRRDWDDRRYRRDYDDRRFRRDWDDRHRHHDRDRDDRWRR
jgi:hypothetical protein